MSNATIYLEARTIIDTDDFNETTESVSITDAITALKIQELDTLNAAYNNNDYCNTRIKELQKQLKHIK